MVTVDKISILLALLNADPAWDPWRLFINCNKYGPIVPRIDVIQNTKHRLFFLAGIPLTLERVSDHHNKLLFSIIQESDAQSKESFDTLKDHLRALVKDNPDILKAQV